MASSPPPSISRVQASMLRAREGVRRLSRPMMVDQRAAAALALGQHHLDAVAVEQPDRRLVDPRPQHLLRAAGQQRHPRAPLGPSAGKTLRRVDGAGARQPRRRQGEHRRELLRAGSRQQRREGPRQARASSASAEAAGMRQHAGQQRAQQPVRERPRGRSSRYGRGA